MKSLKKKLEVLPVSAIIFIGLLQIFIYYTVVYSTGIKLFNNIPIVFKSWYKMIWSSIEQSLSTHYHTTDKSSSNENSYNIMMYVQHFLEQHE